MWKEVFFVNEKGQMEINFEALEMVTSEEFANTVKTYVGMDYEVISVEINSIVSRVHMKSENHYRIFSYAPHDNKIFSNCMTIQDIKWFVKLLEGVQK